MIDSIYHITLKLLKNHFFGVKLSEFCHHLPNAMMDVIMSRYEICKPLVVSQFYCTVLFHSET